MPAYVETLLQQCHDRWPAVHWRAYASDAQEVFADVPTGMRVTVRAADVDSDPDAPVFSGLATEGTKIVFVEGLYTLDQVVQMLRESVSTRRNLETRNQE